MSHSAIASACRSGVTPSFVAASADASAECAEPAAATTPAPVDGFEKSGVKGAAAHAATAAASVFAPAFPRRAPPVEGAPAAAAASKLNGLKVAGRVTTAAIPVAMAVVDTTLAAKDVFSDASVGKKIVSAGTAGLATGTAVATTLAAAGKLASAPALRFAATALAAGALGLGILRDRMD